MLGRSVHDSVCPVTADERKSEAPESPETSETLVDPSEAETLQPGALTEADLAEARDNLEAQLDAARKDAAEIKEKWLRSAADLENYRKRAAKDKEEVQKYANERLLRDFLPVFDDLERTLSALGAVEGVDPQVTDGIELVRKKFLQQLERHGVESFDSVGETFDPARHDAIQQAHSHEVEAGLILEELQRGFLLQGRLLRPAMVVVSLGAPKPDDA